MHTLIKGPGIRSYTLYVQVIPTCSLKRNIKQYPCYKSSVGYASNIRFNPVIKGTVLISLLIPSHLIFPLAGGVSAYMSKIHINGTTNFSKNSAGTFGGEKGNRPVTG